MACECAAREMAPKAGRVGALRERLEHGILSRLREVRLNGHPTARVYNTCNLSFNYIEAEALLAVLDLSGIAVSSGSACSSGTSEPSRVLTAMGIEPVCSRGAVRFSLGPENTEEEVGYCIEVLVPAVQRLQNMSPFFPKEAAR
jgi:cysteine desulfurase